jgi:ketosteroid isomerase-like protein
MTQGIEPDEILRRYHAAINALDFGAIEAMFAADIVYSSDGIGGIVSGRDSVIAAFRAYFEQYPDQHAEDEAVETLSATMARSIWTLRATNAQTGASYSRQGTETVTIDGSGKIVRIAVEG